MNKSHSPTIVVGRIKSRREDGSVNFPLDHDDSTWPSSRLLTTNDRHDNADRHITLAEQHTDMNHVASEFSFLNYVWSHLGKHDLKSVKKHGKLGPMQKSGPDVNFVSDDHSVISSLEKSKNISVSDSMVQLRGGILENYQNIVRKASPSSTSSSSDSSSSFSPSISSDDSIDTATDDDESSTDSSSKSEDELSPPEPPDGGWGWVIVIATFFIQMIDDGVATSFGIFLDDLTEEFGASLSVASWVGSFSYGIPCLAAPVASMLINKFQCRKVCVIGGLISAVGCALAFFVESMLGLVLTFGILVGLGASLSSTAALIIVSLYFEDRRATATGLSIAGSGVGSFVFAPLVNYLITIYTWRGAILVVSGIFTHIVVFGCLMRPLETGRQRRKRQLLLRMENFAKESGFKLPKVYLKSEDENVDRRIHLLRRLLISPQRHSSSDSTSDLSMGSLLITVDSCLKDNIKVEDGKEMQKNTQPRLAFSDITESKVDLSNAHQHPPVLSAATSIRNALSLIPPVYGRTKRSVYHRSAAFQSTTQKHIRPTFSMPDLLGSTPSLLSSPSASSGPVARVRQHLHFIRRYFYRQLRNALDPSIFWSFSFNLFLLSTLGLFFWCNVTYFFITIYANSQVGISNRLAAMLLAIMGGSDMVGEVVYGWAADQEWSNILHLYTSGVVVCGIATMLVPVATSFGALVVYNLVFGFTMAANDSLCTIFIIEFLGLSRLVSGLGFCLFCQGVASIFGPPVIGFIIDATESYTVAFTVCGAGVLLAGLVMLPAIVRQLQHRRAKRRRLEARRQAASATAASGERTENGNVLICSSPSPI
ncbi:monocarboxylate transporter [Echinococcus multilocularis]|uniref:Monocarboxylate transporter n=1 Tax=Echinococcus multilocularis TaxID=6211 RepID=A0A068Y1D5_ECHMU|nr:monocarboxylate transporter [Echinococcus multilocularis]